MELVTKANFEEASSFILSNLKRSAFMYGNLSHANAASYIYRENGQILAMANIIEDRYCTYLFPENTKDQVVEAVIEAMKQYKHIGGTVTGRYKDIFAKHYKLPSNCENEVASLDNFNSKLHVVNDIQDIDVAHVDKYYDAIKTIKEFNKDYEEVKSSFARSKVVAAFDGDKIVSAATMSSLSDKTGVVTSVFTRSDYRGQGHAKDCVRKLLNDYAEGRTLLIFFTNPIAKQIYLDLGFKVDDKLIMFNQPLI